MAKKKKRKKAMRRVRKTRAAKSRRRSATRKTGARKQRRRVVAHRKDRDRRRVGSGKLVSRAIGGQAKAAPHKKRARAVATRNPAQEFVIEAYQPKGRKFFFYDGESRLTSNRNDAARYKSGPEAHRTRLAVARRAPPGIDWVRVCPA